MITRMYRNDNNRAYFIPGLGEIGAGERVSFSGEYPPAINFENYPGLVDVLAEEAAGNPRDYEATPEVVTHRLADGDVQTTPATTVSEQAAQVADGAVNN